MRSPKISFSIDTFERRAQPLLSNILRTCFSANLTLMQGIKIESATFIKSQSTTITTPSGPMSSSLRTPIARPKIEIATVQLEHGH